eukprot:3782711-Pleurochrysis_carterae.AAC.3
MEYDINAGPDRTGNKGRLQTTYAKQRCSTDSKYSHTSERNVDHTNHWEDYGRTCPRHACADYNMCFVAWGGAYVCNGSHLQALIIQASLRRS